MGQVSLRYARTSWGVARGWPATASSAWRPQWHAICLHTRIPRVVASYQGWQEGSDGRRLGGCEGVVLVGRRSGAWDGHRAVRLLGGKAGLVLVVFVVAVRAMGLAGAWVARAGATVSASIHCAAGRLVGPG